MGVIYDPLLRRFKIAQGTWSGYIIVTMWNTFDNMTWSCETPEGEDYDIVNFYIIEDGQRVVLCVREPEPWGDVLILRVLKQENREEDLAEGAAAAASAAVIGHQQKVARKVFDRACDAVYEYLDEERTVA